MDKTSLRLQTSRNLIQKRGEERERERERERENWKLFVQKRTKLWHQSSDASRAFAKINPTSGSTFRISDAFCTTHFPF